MNKFEILLLETISHIVKPYNEINHSSLRDYVHNNLTRNMSIIHGIHPHEDKALTSYSHHQDDMNNRNINNTLRSMQHSPEDLHTHPIVGNVHLLNKALSRAKAPDRDVHVFSGIKADPSEHILKNGGIMHLPAFTSTSTDISKAHFFAKEVDSPLKNAEGEKISPTKHILKIKIGKGQQTGAYIPEHSGYSDEKEFLMKSNQVLKIHPVPSIHHDPTTGHTTKIWSAHVMDKDEISNHKDNPEIKAHISMKGHLNAIARNSYKSFY